MRVGTDTATKPVFGGGSVVFPSDVSKVVPELPRHNAPTGSRKSYWFELRGRIFVVDEELEPVVFRIIGKIVIGCILVALISTFLHFIVAGPIPMVVAGLSMVGVALALMFGSRELGKSSHASARRKVVGGAFGSPY